MTISLPNWINCTTDVSVGTDLSFGAAVFRNHSNKFQGIYSACFNVTNPTLVEAEMLVVAAALASKLNYKFVNFLCDNSTVVTYLNAKDEASHFQLEGVKVRFDNVATCFDEFKVGKIMRAHNFVAHNTAKWARVNQFIGEIDLGILDGSILSDELEWDPG